MRQDILERLSEISEEEQALLQGNPIDLSYYNLKGEPTMEPSVLLPGGEQFGIRRHTRFVDFPRHGHDYVEMIYQIQGKTEHIINNAQPVTLTAGKLLLLSRGVQHEIKAAGQDDIAMNFILIPVFFDSAAMSLGDGNSLTVFLRGNLLRNKPAAGHLLYDVSGVTIVENLLENLIIGQLEGVSLSIQQLTLEILFRSLSGISKNIVANEKSDMEQALVLSILSDIEQHPRLNLSDIAASYGIEITALSRMIKRYTGCSFMDLLHTARFNRALSLLRDSNLSVVNIASTIGYENTSFFYRRFSQLYGCTPISYREKYRQTAQK